MIIDQSNFDKGKLYAIGTHHMLGRELRNARFGVDVTHTYSEWLKNYQSFRSIQLSKIDDDKKIKAYFKKVKKWNTENIRNTYVFYNPVIGHNLDMHHDEEHVRLYVIKGFKKVYVGKKIIYLKAGEHVDIPAYTPHRAFSIARTWAVSFGMYKFD